MKGDCNAAKSDIRVRSSYEGCTRTHPKAFRGGGRAELKKRITTGWWFVRIEWSGFLPYKHAQSTRERRLDFLPVHLGHGKKHRYQFTLDAFGSKHNVMKEEDCKRKNLLYTKLCTHVKEEVTSHAGIALPCAQYIPKNERNPELLWFIKTRLRIVYCLWVHMGTKWSHLIEFKFFVLFAPCEKNLR